MTKVGVLELESFFPASDRFGLAMRLNNVLAAPGFAAWLEGEPLDIARCSTRPAGKPRVAIVSIAHLGDAERMFFVSLLLEQVLAVDARAARHDDAPRACSTWTRSFGYPAADGQSADKTPLLTLLKQARAFGLGCVLATQNPVDLDYKALSNAGTWFLGRLQTERDKARVLDGLEGVARALDTGSIAQGLDQLLSGLDKRVFLLHNVHDSAPFSSRRGGRCRTCAARWVATKSARSWTRCAPRRRRPSAPALRVAAAPPVLRSAASGHGRVVRRRARSCHPTSRSSSLRVRGTRGCRCSWVPLACSTATANSGSTRRATSSSGRRSQMAPWPRIGSLPSRRTSPWAT